MASSAASSAASAAGAQKTNYTVKDSTGLSVTFDKVPERIVSLLPSDTEVLFDLGLADKIQAVSEFDSYPEAAKSKTHLPTGEKLNLEQLIALKPDVVFMAKMGQTKEQVAKLTDAGIKVVVTDAQSIDGISEVIKLVGEVTGTETKAADIVSSMQKKLADIKAKVPKGDQKSVYFEVSPLEYGLWTSGKNTFMDEIATMLNLKNTFADTDGWAEISEEQVISRNPDYIVTTSGTEYGVNGPVKEILARKGWDAITAVKTQKVFQADSDMLTRTSPRLADGVQQLYDFIYGNVQ
ncbi:MAG: ABC transporter substrate-binding protein [Bacillota bacterium]|nr:ABC transporter substrate-binding protein [Bacillota bacterium]